METWPLNQGELKVDEILRKKHPNLDKDQRHNLIRGYEQFSKDQMFAAAEDCARWNKDYGKRLLNEPCNKSDRLFYSAFIEMFHGTDKWGHPVSTLNFATMDHAKLAKVLKDPTNLIRVQSKKLLASAYLKDRISKCLKRRVRKNIFIMNLNGLSIYSFYRHKDIVKGIMDVGLKYFPETLLKVYLVNPSRVFYVVWKIAKFWLDPVTLGNIHVVSDLKKARDLWREDGINIEALPKELGGQENGCINFSEVIERSIATSSLKQELKTTEDVEEEHSNVESKMAGTTVGTSGGSQVTESKSNSESKYASSTQTRSPQDRSTSPKKRPNSIAMFDLSAFGCSEAYDVPLERMYIVKSLDAKRIVRENRSSELKNFIEAKEKDTTDFKNSIVAKAVVEAKTTTDSKIARDEKRSRDTGDTKDANIVKETVSVKESMQVLQVRSPPKKSSERSIVSSKDSFLVYPAQPDSRRGKIITSDYVPEVTMLSSESSVSEEKSPEAKSPPITTEKRLERAILKKKKMRLRSFSVSNHRIRLDDTNRFLRACADAIDVSDSE